MNTKIAVHAHKLKDRAFHNWHTEVSGRWKITDLRADEGYCNDWISVDSLAWDQQKKLLYVGLNCINTDIFYTFDPGSNAFESLGFQRVSDKFDVKLHRSIELDGDGALYLATALLHDLDEQHEAKGGKVFRYDPSTEQYTLLGVPIPSNYIQSIVLDPVNRLLYGFTYPSEQLFCFDLNTGECKSLAYVGNGVMISQPHCGVIDRNNCLWGTWGETRAYEYAPGPVPIRIFRYDPSNKQFTWFQHGFGKTSASDPARVDHMMLGADGLIYAGTVSGGLSRLNPETGAVEYLGKPFSGDRLAGLVQGSDGRIYGAGNSGYDSYNNGTSRLFAFDPKTGDIEDLGAIADSESGAGASCVHILVEGENGTFYAGENDNIWRSSYLWECRLLNA
jgi:outer membrane protein assembly factor BamB